AHRTSPTNMGLGLLANLAAYDFGYICGKEMAERCKNTFKTMLKLERYDGHFYNWYNTLTLSPLHPKYVSTVDTGNLVGNLLTLRQGLLSQSTEPIFKKNFYEGLITTVRIIQEDSNKLYEKETEKIISLLYVALSENDNSLSSLKKTIEELTLLIRDLSLVRADAGLEKWISKLSRQLNSFYDDLLQLVPWINLLPVPDSFKTLDALDTIPSLYAILDHSKFLETINSYQR